MAWMHKTVVKEYDMDDKEQQDDDVEKYKKTDTYSPEPIGADISILSPTSTTNSQMSDP